MDIITQERNTHKCRWSTKGLPKLEVIFLVLSMSELHKCSKIQKQTYTYICTYKSYCQYISYYYPETEIIYVTSVFIFFLIFSN